MRRGCQKTAGLPLYRRRRDEVCELGRRVVRRGSCTLVAEEVADDRTLTRMLDTGFPLDQLFIKPQVICSNQIADFCHASVGNASPLGTLSAQLDAPKCG